MTVRSKHLVEGVLLRAAQTTVATVPPGRTWLVKQVTVVNTDAVDTVNATLRSGIAGNVQPWWRGDVLPRQAMQEVGSWVFGEGTDLVCNFINAPDWPDTLVVLHLFGSELDGVAPE